MSIPDNKDKIITRLQKSGEATLLTAEQITAYCKQHNISHSTDFSAVTTAPDGRSLKETFLQAYTMAPLPPSTLKEKGARAVIVFESKKFENPKGPIGANHGEVVAAIAEITGKSLNSDVEVIYIHASINPNYRRQFEAEADEQITQLMKHQGAAVIHTSLGWDDEKLGFGSTVTEEQSQLMRDIAAFVTDSAGNDGKHGWNGTYVPIQKHNAVSHFPPLVVHVGAVAAGPDGSYQVEGYSSANGPSLVAPLHKEVMLNWGKPEKILENITGVSAASPVMSGMFAALNARYGAYIPREYILYAALATAEPVDTVSADTPKTPQARELQRITNAAGLSFEPEYSGFGAPDPYKADKLLAAMVAKAQDKPKLLSVPEESSIDLSTEAGAHVKAPNGKFTYEIEAKAGTVLKNELWVDFQKLISPVELTSPSGTTIPVHLSRHLNKNRVGATSFGLATTHAFAGEEQQGKWTITSEQPIATLRMYTTHFKSQDLIREVDVNTALESPTPDLSNARNLRELLANDDLWVNRIKHTPMQMQRGLSMQGNKFDLSSDEAILSALQELPHALTERTRAHNPIAYADDANPGWLVEKQGHAISRKIMEEDTPELRQERIGAYLEAARIYEERGEVFQLANVLSLAAQAYRSYPSFTLPDGKHAPEEAIALFQKAIALHEVQGNWDHAYRDTDMMYGAVTDSIRSYKRTGPEEKVQELFSLLEQVQDNAVAFSSRMQGTPDPRAHRVEEGEAGFSSTDPIGTDNVSQCLTLFVQEPVSKRTGVVHIDYENNLTTLRDFFSQFPSQPLQARVVGARFDQDPRSAENISNIMRAIRNRRVDIISADVWGGDSGPSAAVVDPQSFEIREAVPTRENPNRHISNAITLFSRQNKPILTDFDLDVSTERAPTLMPEGTAALLRQYYIGKDAEEIDAWMYDQKIQDRALMSHHIEGMLEAYSLAHAPLVKALEDSVREWREEGVMVSDNTFAQARAAIDNADIYLGTHAAEFNWAVVDAIKSKLLYEGQGSQVEVDPTALTELKLSPNTYSAFRQKEARNTGRG